MRTLVMSLLMIPVHLIGKKILIVDDEFKIRQLYSSALQSEGYEVFEAADWPDAAKFLISQLIDLVVLDIHVPIVDGVCMSGMIGEIDPKIKILVASVYPLSHQRRLIIDADDYFDKAEGLHVLVDKVRNVLSSAYIREVE